MRVETPVYGKARANGATFIEEAGWVVASTFGDDDAALDTVRQGAGLADRSARGRVTILGAGVGALLQRVWGVHPLPSNGGAPVAVGWLYRLRHDRYFLSTTPGDAAEAIATLEDAVVAEDGLITISDATHGHAELWLLGPAAPSLLSHLCGLDFHPTAFPDQTAKESSVAKTKQLIMRHDVGGLPTYALSGGRSYGAYLWETIVAAAQTKPFTLLGESALRRLEEETP